MQGLSEEKELAVVCLKRHLARKERSLIPGFKGSVSESLLLQLLRCYVLDLRKCAPFASSERQCRRALA